MPDVGDLGPGGVVKHIAGPMGSSSLNLILGKGGKWLGAVGFLLRW